MKLSRRFTGSVSTPTHNSSTSMSGTARAPARMRKAPSTMTVMVTNCEGVHARPEQCLAAIAARPALQKTLVLDIKAADFVGLVGEGLHHANTCQRVLDSRIDRGDPLLAGPHGPVHVAVEI